MEWYEQIEGTMFTFLENNLHEEFPDLNCTTIAQNYITETDTEVNGKFPTMYMYNTLQETGNDLDNGEVNAVRCVTEIKVYHNTSNYECERVAMATLKQMKALRFNASRLPLTMPYKNIYLSVFTCHRVIGGGDKLIIE